MALIVWNGPNILPGDIVVVMYQYITNPTAVSDHLNPLPHEGTYLGRGMDPPAESNHEKKNEQK